jgi:hypothetical protein
MYIKFKNTTDSYGAPSTTLLSVNYFTVVVINTTLGKRADQQLK